MLAPLFPELLALATHQRPDRKVVRYLPPPKHSLPADLSQSLPVRRIIFPWYDPDSPTALRSLSHAEALSRLLSQCQAVPLDLGLMAGAVAPLLGTHDFTSFRCSECGAATPVRTIHDIRIVPVEGGAELIFEGTSFLMHQVRIMAGTLVEVGRGRRPAESLDGVLRSRGRRCAGQTAPPEGLCLEKVWYEARWGVGEPSPWGERTG